MRLSRLITGGLLAPVVVLLGASPAAAALFSTATSIGSSPNPACGGQAVTFTARVSSGAVNPAEPTPAGTVHFADDGRPLATVPLNGNGVAVFSTPALSIAAHRISANYSGDFWYASSSASLTQQVKSCGGPKGGQGQGQAPPPPVIIGAAGDIACAPTNPRFNSGFGTSEGCLGLSTSNLLGPRALSAVLPLGDLVQEGGDSLDLFRASYDPAWGRWRAISHPAIGNHEYDDQRGAQGYWDYWNGVGHRKGPAGIRGRGWYSFDVGSWHLVALNSNCDLVSCRGRSRQVKWLRRNLRKSRGRCVLAYMHHPRFSSGIYENHQKTGRLWKALYHRGADVVLNGHDQIYERFGPQRPSGKIDRRRGITQFTVGTGGYVLFSIASPRARHSQFASANFGVLFLRLAEKSYEWSFVDIAGQTIDHGARRCHPGKPRGGNGDDHHRPG